MTNFDLGTPPPPLKQTIPHQNNETNEENNEKIYKSRIQTNNITLRKIKQTGYDPQEALEYFPQIMKESSENKRRYEELHQKIEFALETLSKTVHEKNRTDTLNKRLRGCIMHLHPDDYWEVLRKAEKGYYELLRNQ